MGWQTWYFLFVIVSLNDIRYNVRYVLDDEGISDGRE